MCYLALLFAPFGLLKQMAVFSAAGIFSTFLTAVCIYPLIKIPEGERKIPLLSLFKNPLKAKGKMFSSFGIVFLFAFCISVFIFTSFGKQTEKCLNGISEKLILSLDDIKQRLPAGFMGTLGSWARMVKDLNTAKMRGIARKIGIDEKELNKLFDLSNKYMNWVYQDIAIPEFL